MLTMLLDKMLVIDDAWVASNGRELRDTVIRPTDTFKSNPLVSVRTSNVTFRNVHLRNWDLDWYPKEATQAAWGTSFNQGGPSLPHLGRWNPWLYGWHSQTVTGQVLENLRWIDCSVAGFAGEGWALNGPTRGLRFEGCYARNTYGGIELRWSGQAQYQHEDVEITGFYGRDHWAPQWWRDSDPYAAQLEVASLRAEVGKGEIRLGGCRNVRVRNCRSDGATGGIKIYGPTDAVSIQGCETGGFMFQSSKGAFAPVRNVWVVRNQIVKPVMAGARFTPGANFSGDVHLVLLGNTWVNAWKVDATSQPIYEDGNGINLNVFEGLAPTAYVAQNLFVGWNAKAGVKDAVAVKVDPAASINGDWENVNSYFDQARRK